MNGGSVDLTELVLAVVEQLKRVDEARRARSELLRQLVGREEAGGEKERGREEGQNGARERDRGRRGAVEILEEEGFAFEPLLKLREPDAFFAKLRGAGALVFELRDGRLAVTPQLWEQLRKVLADSGPKAEGVTGDKRLQKLFRILSEQGALLYDEAKGWVLPQPQT